MRLINGDALIKALNLAEWFNLADFNEAVYTVRKAQPVDAVPVVHGHWIIHEWAEEVDNMLIPNYECSVCGIWKRDDTAFCPNCGADMRRDGERG